MVQEINMLTKLRLLPLLARTPFRFRIISIHLIFLIDNRSIRVSRHNYNYAGNRSAFICNLLQQHDNYLTFVFYVCTNNYYTIDKNCDICINCNDRPNAIRILICMEKIMTELNIRIYEDNLHTDSE